MVRRVLEARAIREWFSGSFLAIRRALKRSVALPEPEDFYQAVHRWPISCAVLTEISMGRQPREGQRTAALFLKCFPALE